MTEITTINLFYPLLFFTIVIALGLITFCFFKVKDTFIFAKSNDNAKDVTLDVNNKFSKAHTELVCLPEKYEKELHSLEVTVKDLSKKVDLLFEIITELKSRGWQQH